MKRRLAVLLAITGAVGQTSVAAPVQDSDEAVYLRRFAENGGAQRTGYDDTMEAVPSAAHVTPLPKAVRGKLAPKTLDRARSYALANNSKALLVWVEGKLEQEVYGPGVDAATPINSGSMSKPLGAIAVGRAIMLKKLRSLDQPVTDFLPEWRGTPKAAITIRHLLAMTSGLLEQGQSADPANIWSRAYLHPRHDRILLEDYPLSAPPGTRYQYSNASADLIAIIIERATGRRYAEFVSTEIIKPLGAAGGEIWLDRVGGLAHSGCCILVPAQTWLRLGLLLLDDGVWQGRRLLPRGYVTEMRTPTAQHPRYGLGIWLPGPYVLRRGFGRPDQLGAAQILHSEPYVADDLFLFDGNGSQVLYMVPSRRLAILRMGPMPPRTPEWDNTFLPNLVLRDLAGRH
jgi:CubicO group peptidase (beta-lactamase class C family)